MNTNSKFIAFVNVDTLEYDFDAIEDSVRSGSIGFGNPRSKLTQHEQFLLWKRMIQEGLFQNRDEYCKSMAAYSSFQQAQQHLDSLRPIGDGNDFRSFYYIKIVKIEENGIVVFEGKESKSDKNFSTYMTGEHFRGEIQKWTTFFEAIPQYYSYNLRNSNP